VTSPTTLRKWGITHITQYRLNRLNAIPPESKVCHIHRIKGKSTQQALITTDIRTLLRSLLLITQHAAQYQRTVAVSANVAETWYLYLQLKDQILIGYSKSSLVASRDKRHCTSDATPNDFNGELIMSHNDLLLARKDDQWTIYRGSSIQLRAS